MTLVYYIFLLFSQISYAYDCSYYELNDKKHICHENNYLMNYGKKYCNIFGVLKKESSSNKLKKWIEDTSKCLQEMLDEGAENRHKWNCEATLEYAFDVHPICYKVFGICKLTTIDKLAIIKTLFHGDIISDSFKNKRASFIQIFNVSLKCISELITPSYSLFYNKIYENYNGLKHKNNILSLIEMSPVISINEVEKYFSIVNANLILKNVNLKNIDSMAKHASQIAEAYSKQKYENSVAESTNVDISHSIPAEAKNKEITDKDILRTLKAVKKYYKK